MIEDNSANRNQTRFQPKLGCVRLPLSAADLANYSEIIDTRSPSEWQLDHLPGAISVPVLEDAEREHVGRLYKQVSSFEAKKVGAALVARNIARHLETALAAKPKNWRPLIYCWRGGARSAAFTHILRQIGWDATQLEGGYKRWRTQVVADLQELPRAFSFRAICGRTGSGKSRLLTSMHALGAQVLDLEALAGHRGSVLGDIPNQPQPTQKMFESRIWVELSKFDPTRPVFVEAESKKIGLLRVPEVLIERMWHGECIELLTPQSLRVRLLVEEYAHLIADPALMHFKIDCLSPLHARQRIDGWHRLVDAGAWDHLVADLLDSHYDPAYDRSMFKNYQGIRRARNVSLTAISSEGFRSAALSTLTMGSTVGVAVPTSVPNFP
ncbi:MAG: tRNA 2-selenouridine(34) synthase MnmH [Rhodocyclaceae bacterium]|nr:tRNA 2-selenouridine(34) synthase MnmH [Rhodocyclaceae bacterium]